MLSTSCKYALRAAVYVMANANSITKKVGIKEIAQEIEANEHTTGKILQLLVKEKIIASAKGPNGGFYISPHTPKIHLIDIVKVVDGVGFFFECGLGLQKCSERKPCPIHHSYKASREKLHKEFSTITVQELASNIEKGMAFLKR
ncbi:MAG TPA: Rrf2 family transcriptional regulator [Flavisolibacter sp.]|nr:Rrf2 family transcriptional regulator [Flavisolibacter sp.]